MGAGRTTAENSLAEYVGAVVAACECAGATPVSVVVFGSAARGGFAEGSSDVDLFVIVPDDTSRTTRTEIRRALEALEIARGLRPAPNESVGRLTRMIERAGDGLSTFVCTHADFLSADPARVFGLPRAQARFVDRIVLANIVASARTMHGDELLADVRVLPIRRLDVLKAGLALHQLTLCCALAYPLLPRATKHAMGALKRSLHSCFYAMERRAAALPEEVAHFDRRFGPSATMRELLALRASYRPSYAFVWRALVAIARLHARTAVAVRFAPET